jgi:hypothetical protein
MASDELKIERLGGIAGAIFHASVLLISPGDKDMARSNLRDA